MKVRREGTRRSKESSLLLGVSYESFETISRIFSVRDQYAMKLDETKS